MNKPELNEGEIYAGAVIAPDGTGHHVILLDGDKDGADWNTQMEWAKSIGGDLPDRAEQALFNKYMLEEFQKDWYWSNTQHAGTSNYAWCQYFKDGGQGYYGKSCECRARSVRRVAI
jgi:hypothetical protein